MKKCFGIISWFPDAEPHRSQRLNRLSQTFKHLIDLFGEDIEFLIVAQNWKDYKVPDFVKHTTIYKFDKLGILGARKMLREKFLESKYDYLIMCDDDIVLKSKVENAPQKYLEELDKHPECFSFIRYSWSLTFCAVSRWVYSRVEMVDIDPEKNEGYEDVTFPWLLHYKFPLKEFKTSHLIEFLQNTAEYKKGHKSTWEGKDVSYNELKSKTTTYVNNFRRGNFDIPQIKKRIEEEWERRKSKPNTTYMGDSDNYLYF